MVAKFTDSDFQKNIDAESLTVVDFWAEWCGPCKMVAPVIEELSEDYDGKVTFGKVNVDHNPETSMKYGIRSIPTILYFKAGEIVDKVVGAVPKSRLDGMVKKHL